MSMTLKHVIEILKIFGLTLPTTLNSISTQDITRDIIDRYLQYALEGSDK